MLGQLAFAPYQRKINFVKKTSVTCMIAEAAGVNWMFSGPGNTPKQTFPNGESNWMGALAARHGKTARNHGYTNIAYFDGHVAVFDTKALSTYVNPTTNTGGADQIPQSMGVVFTINNSR
jgi:prepilin-type processing-associated H-X9-DG protein